MEKDNKISQIADIAKKSAGLLECSVKGAGGLVGGLATSSPLAVAAPIGLVASFNAFDDCMNANRIHDGIKEGTLGPEYTRAISDSSVVSTSSVKLGCILEGGVAGIGAGALTMAAGPVTSAIVGTAVGLSVAKDCAEVSNVRKLEAQKQDEPEIGQLSAAPTPTSHNTSGPAR